MSFKRVLSFVSVAHQRRCASCAAACLALVILDSHLQDFGVRNREGIMYLCDLYSLLIIKPSMWWGKSTLLEIWKKHWIFINCNINWKVFRKGFMSYASEQHIWVYSRCCYALKSTKLKMSAMHTVTCQWKGHILMPQASCLIKGGGIIWDVSPSCISGTSYKNFPNWEMRAND